MNRAPTGDTRPVLLRNATLADGSRADVRLRGDVIEAVEPPTEGPATRSHEIDLTGHLLLPAPVEIHAHLDKALTADQVRNPTDDLLGAVTSWLRHRPSMTEAEITARARSAIHTYVGHGATTIRSHVDVGDGIELRALAAIDAARTELADYCTVQMVAFATTPLTGAAGATNRALLKAALEVGADAVGACPGIDPNPADCIDLCLSLAARHSLPVDLHIDEWLTPEPFTLQMLADAVLATGFDHGVVASHCVSLGMMAPDQIRLAAEKVAAAGIAVAALPQTNLYLQAKEYDSAPPRGLTAVRALREAGVTLAAGGDNVQDPFNPLGRADPLDAAALMVLAGHDSPTDAYASISTAARQAIGLAPVAVAAGSPAELMAVRASSIREAVANAPADRLVIHAGRVVARTSVQRSFAEHPREENG